MQPPQHQQVFKLRLGELGILVLAVLLLIALWYSGRNAGNNISGFPLDDAWIHMVYGKGLAVDGAFTYNAGTPASGATSLLWAGVLGVLHALFDWAPVEFIVVATYAINGLLFLMTIFGAMALSRALGSTPDTSYVTGLSLASAPLYAVSIFSGMEIMLCSALLIFGVSALVRMLWGRSGLLLGLACTVRPEAALVLIAAGLVMVSSLIDQYRGGTASPTALLRQLLRFTAAPLLLGASAISYYIWSSGRPLPATFYFKESLSLWELPTRLWLAIGEMLSLVTPFSYWIAWIGLLGCALIYMDRRRYPESDFFAFVKPFIPIGAGLIFLAANVLLIAPVDPSAFYHQRYILPAVPLLLVGLVLGFQRLSFSQQPWVKKLPLHAFAFFCILLGLSSIASVSRSYHSDVRNINELQRALGIWARDHTSDEAWIASNDAGAVRYFSERRVIDIMGLNTPELYWNAPMYARSHPIEAVIFMPSWFMPASTEGFHLLAQATTADYTVTSSPAMATQVALGCPTADDSRPIPLRLIGMRELTLYCVPTLFVDKQDYSVLNTKSRSSSSQAIRQHNFRL